MSCIQCKRDINVEQYNVFDKSGEVCNSCVKKQVLTVRIISVFMLIAMIFGNILLFSKEQMFQDIITLIPILRNQLNQYIFGFITIVLLGWCSISLFRDSKNRDKMVYSIIARNEKK